MAVRLHARFTGAYGAAAQAIVEVGLIQTRSEDLQREVARLQAKVAALERDEGARSTPRYRPGLCTTVPKSGTHLIAGILNALPHYSAEIRDGGRPLDKSAIAALEPGQIRVAHNPFWPRVAQFLSQLGYHRIFLIRDPRSIVCSFMRYVTYKDKNHPYHSYFAEVLQTDHERLITAITGVSADPATSRPRIPDMAERLQSFLSWGEYPGTLVVRYEKLVGSNAGGDDEIQRAEVLRIAEYLGLQMAQDEVTEVIERGTDPKRSATFDRGHVESWRSELAEEHCTLIQEIAGDTLIALGYEPDAAW